MSSQEKSKTINTQSVSQKRRNRRRNIKKQNSAESIQTNEINNLNNKAFAKQILGDVLENSVHEKVSEIMMKDNTTQSKEDVKAAREAKKLAKQKAKNKEPAEGKLPVSNPEIKAGNSVEGPSKQVKSKDEVDRATLPLEIVKQVAQETEKDKDLIKAERAAKKAAKQAKKKGSGDVPTDITESSSSAQPEMTVRDVVETLRDIKDVAQQVKEVTDRVQALDLDKKKPSEKTKEAPKESSEEGGKSKAEMKAERRAKQEAQRAAKEAATQEKAAAAKAKEKAAQPPKEATKTLAVKEKSPKPKTPGKQSTKQQGHKVNWFRHLYNDDIKAKLNNIPINSNLHPAIIKLGVQLATRVVTGSNARCIALLDALKKMVRDYSLPAKTEFGRGLESHLATSLQFLWSMRQPNASQTNAVKFFRHHLTQLPNNVDEFDAKKTLQEEIDRYIREQIEMAGEAISITVRNKISDGDNILTYGCSSLIERILVEAHEAGVQFRCVVCGEGGGGGAGRGRGRGGAEMARRLTARGVVCARIDITALGFAMHAVTKVVVGASSLLANGSVLGAAGTAAVAAAARSFNIPVLVACETHKFSDRVQTDAFVYNEIGDPDDLIDKSDENSPLKDWRSNPNLTPLNLTYDVTPPSLVTAVVTELAILPCTSAPVVLRFKLSEYSM